MYEVSNFTLKLGTPIQLDTLSNVVLSVFLYDFQKKSYGHLKKNKKNKNEFFHDIAKNRINFRKQIIFSELTAEELAFMQNQQKIKSNSYFSN